MTRLRRRRSLAVVLALGLLAVTLLPARADSSIVPIAGPASLAIPETSVPSGYTVDAAQSGPMTGRSLLVTLGKHTSTLLQGAGLTAGYHGWLNANDLTYKAFVTYDFYGFKSASGAAATSILLQGLALGVQTPTAQAGLPDGAQVFVDSTGVFGPEQKPFVAVEIIFRVQNVLADVTGYYEGGDSATISAAANGSISAASTIGDWLAERARGARTGLLPLILLPVALARRLSGRRQS